MRFGIGIFPAESKISARKVVEAVQEAEAAGFDRAWIIDSQGLFRDVYVTLTLCAERTGRNRAWNRRDERGYAASVRHRAVRCHAG